MNIHYITSIRTSSNINAAESKLLYFKKIIKNTKLVTIFKVDNSNFISLYDSNIFFRTIKILIYSISIPRYDLIISYNYQYYNFLVFIVAKIKGIKIYLDIEDAPTKLIDRIFLKIYLFIASKEFRFYANNYLSDKYNSGVKNNIIFYGSYDYKNKDSFALSKDKITVHLGGTHNQYTGISLLISLLLKQKMTGSTELNDFNFIVTGYLPNNIYCYIKSLNINNVKIYGTLNKNELEKLYSKIEVGLQLRNPKFEFSKQTFPSKVLEYIRRGIFTISSNVSDIEHFSNFKNIKILSQYDEATLKNALIMYKCNRINSRINFLSNIDNQFRNQLNEIF
jgi:hypothetical protein